MASLLIPSRQGDLDNPKAGCLTACAILNQDPITPRIFWYLPASTLVALGHGALLLCA
jgi:hypothetical protein